MKCNRRLTWGAMVIIMSSCDIASAEAIYSFTTLPNPPDSIAAEARDINNSGQIVGSFNNATGSHGFLYSAGVFTTIDDPNAPGVPITGTALWDINNSGQIVGGLIGVNSWVYTGGSFTTIAYPGAAGTGLSGINDIGQIVGGFSDSLRYGASHGFVYTGGSFTVIDYPGSLSTGLVDINNSGQIIGSFSLGELSSHSFLYSDGIFTPINYPGTNGSRTYATGLNSSAEIIGFVGVSGGAVIVQGFLYTDGVFTTINYPGATHTFPSGINDEGQIVGTYYDGTNDNGYSFLATPVPVAVPEPRTSLPVAGLCLGTMFYALARKAERSRSRGEQLHRGERDSYPGVYIQCWRTSGCDHPART